MPYSSTKELPDKVKKLPEAAKNIFMKAFNNAYEKYGEKKAFKIAWAAVKNNYLKKKDKWVKKSFDEETKSIDAGIIVGREHEHHFDNRILPLSRVVECKKVDLNGSAAAWVKTKFNKHHPEFKTAKGSIEDGFLQSYSIEFIADPSKASTYDLEEFGTIRMLDGFDWTGLTYTGKPINPDAKITNYYTDDNGDFYAEGYAMVETIDRVGDLIMEDAVDYAVHQANEALGMKSNGAQIEVKLDLEEIKSESKEEIKMTEEEKTEVVEEQPKVEETPKEEPKEEVVVEETKEEVTEAPAEEEKEEVPAEEPKEEVKALLEEINTLKERLDKMEEIKSVKEEVKAAEPEMKAEVDTAEEKFEEKKEETKSTALWDIVSDRLTGGQ